MNRKGVITEQGRQCTRCNEYKTWEHYYKHPTGAGGRNAVCIPCHNEISRENRKKIQLSPEKHERFLQRQREYWKAKRARAGESDEKIAALSLSMEKVSGQRRRCVICGDPALAYVPDYRRPLDIIWTCEGCSKRFRMTEYSAVMSPSGGGTPYPWPEGPPQGKN